MLRIRPVDLSEAGGFLGALSEVSARYVHDLVKPHLRASIQNPPDRFIVHKSPHLDEYLAELLFRAALNRPQRQREFIEQALYQEDDSNAKRYWPTSAVFGIGAGKPCAEYALHLFDEHETDGGRTDDSCAAIVQRAYYASLPFPLNELFDESDFIDSHGRAHDLHLNNLLKTSHSTLYDFGRGNRGRFARDKLSGPWKRAIVDSLLAAVIYCGMHNIDIRASAAVKKDVDNLMKRFAASSCYKEHPQFNSVYSRMKGLLTNVKPLEEYARYEKDGQSRQQRLLLPYLCVAACEAWGSEIAFFLVSPFFEADFLKTLHFQKTLATLEKAFDEAKSTKRLPRDIIHPDFSIWFRNEKSITQMGRYKGHGGENSVAPRGSYLWLFHMRYHDTLVQPNKAIANFLSVRNYGVGLILVENVEEGTKALFSGNGVETPFWNQLVDAIQTREPDLWYRPEGAPFMVNGTASHQYIPKSNLNIEMLAKLSRKVGTG